MSRHLGGLPANTLSLPITPEDRRSAIEHALRRTRPVFHQRTLAIQEDLGVRPADGVLGPQTAAHIAVVRETVAAWDGLPKEQPAG